MSQLVASLLRNLLNPEAVACRSLLMACQNGNITNVVTGIQKNLYNINCLEKDGSGCLHVATRLNIVGFLESLLKEYSNLVDMNLMVRRNASLNDDCEMGEHLKHDHYTPLMIASELGFTEIVRLFLAYGANPKLEWWDDDPLTLAVFSGHLDIVKILYETDQFNKDDQELLLLACRKGHFSIVEYLVEIQKLNPVHNEKSCSIWDVSPIESAAIGGSLEVITYLVHQGANPRVKDDLPLFLSASNGHPELIRFFLSVGGNPNARYQSGYTSLLAAISHNCTECVNLLLKAGASVVLPINSNYTILHPIVSSPDPNLQIFTLLLNAGANINETDQWGNSVVMKISQFGHQELWNSIIESNLNVDLYYRKPSDGYNALMLASLCNRLNMVKALCQHGFDSNVRNLKGSSALILASAEGHYRVVKYLVEKCDADITIKNNYGKTAIDWAKKEGHTDIVNYLRHRKISRKKGGIRSESR